MNLDPKNQEKLLGFNNLFNHFVKLLDNKKFPNKIMISGPKGIGKSTFAYHIINYIFSKNEKNPYNLNECKIQSENKSFNLIKNLSHPNFYLIDLLDGKKLIEISQIRKAISYSQKSSFNDNYRIVLIDNIESLNSYSANALLKIIEEIPSKTYFIFCSKNLISLPETIISRARVIRDLNSKINFSDFNSMKEDIVRQNQNISEELIHSLINPFIDSKSTDFFEKIKLFNKDQISVCSLIFLKILNYYLRINLNNKKLYKYLLKLHSDYLTDVDESLKFNTLTNDLISIYFTRLNSNLIKYV